jgi:hypothetical protein
MLLAMRTMAPFWPQVSKNICATGWPVAELIVASISWIENSKPNIRNHPRIAETDIAMMIPIDAALAAYYNQPK